MTRLGILLSGRGSNFLAIASAISSGKLLDAEIAVVISNDADAGGLARARELQLPAAVFVSKGRKRAEHDADVAACLREHAVDLVILAGYMRLLSPEFIAAFPNKILNIHPSLLPAFPGLDAQTQAFNWIMARLCCSVVFLCWRATTRTRSRNVFWPRSMLLIARRLRGLSRVNIGSRGGVLCGCRAGISGMSSCFHF
jgi:phosphoribosylglycinamide formyltransferase-1